MPLCNTKHLQNYFKVKIYFRRVSERVDVKFKQYENKLQDFVLQSNFSYFFQELHDLDQANLLNLNVFSFGINIVVHFSYLAPGTFNYHPQSSEEFGNDFLFQLTKHYFHMIIKSILHNWYFRINCFNTCNHNQDINSMANNDLCVIFYKQFLLKN